MGRKGAVADREIAKARANKRADRMYFLQANIDELSSNQAVRMRATLTQGKILWFNE
jgi:hypothetical protein